MTQDNPNGDDVRDTASAGGTRVLPVPPTEPPTFWTLRNYCQRADPPVQLSVPMKVCGRTDGLRITTFFGAFYRLCPDHFPGPSHTRVPDWSDG